MKHVATCTLALCLSAPLVGAWAQAAPAMSAQERLDAIRHSLVETALQGATQVKSTVWLDAQGQLHDSASFRSGMEVRGVRVLSYSRDSAGQAQAQLEAAGPPKDLARSLDEKSSRHATCMPGAPNSLRHVIGLNILFEPGTPAGIQKLVRQQIQDQWMSNPERNWRMLDRAQIAPVLSTGKMATAYEQALTRHGPEQLPWKASLRIASQTTPLKTWEKVAAIRPHHIDLSMSLSVSPLEGQGLQFQTEDQLSLPMSTNDWSASSLDTQGVNQLKAQWNRWAEQLAPWLGCDTVQPKVTDRRAQSLQIDAGSLAGVRKGDEWLLADPQAFPSRVVDKKSSSMLLAKVVDLSPYHAKLAVLAGPADAIQTHWRAWPAEWLNR